MIIQLTTPLSFVNAGTRDAALDCVDGKSLDTQELVAAVLAPRKLDGALRDPETVRDERDERGWRRPRRAPR
jgi:hypothetical protein